MMLRFFSALIVVLHFSMVVVDADPVNGIELGLKAGDDFVDAGGSSTFFDPLANDAVYGLKSLNPLSFSIVDLPQHGQVFVDSTSAGVQLGYIRLAPGPDSALYEVCLTDGACDRAMLWFLEGAIGPLVSSFADRGESLELEAASLSGEVSIFVPDLLPSGAVSSVRFLLNGEPAGFERYPPYDLAGGSEAVARPLNTASYKDGAIAVTTEIKFTAAAGGHLERIESQAKIANTPLIAFSYSKERTSAGILDGGFFGGDVFVFLGILPLNPGIGPVPWNLEGVLNVEFFLDDEPITIERFAPYDLGGGSVVEGYPFNMSSLNPGHHSIKAVAHLNNGRQIIAVAGFESID